MAKKVTLTDAVKPEHYKRKITFNCIVTGKSIVPYQIPKTITIKCGTSNKMKCNECKIRTHKGQIELKPDIKFLGVADNTFVSTIKKILNISCDFSHTVDDVYLIEELYLNSPMSNQEEVSTSRLAYFVGKDIPCNIELQATGYTIPEPKQQKAVHIITDYKTTKTNLDAFDITQEMKKGFKIFNPEQSDDVDSIYDKLEDIYNVYSHNVTKIYHRFDLHMAIDLVYHSVLSYKLGNELVHKGWADVMILGDTRCGKGYVAEGLMKYYGAGDIVSGENVSIAGLIGGVQQIGSRWILTWGKIPMSDRRLVLVDEAGAMEGILQKLSRVRSEGIAEITKVKTERSFARTRLIFLANPNKGRAISSFTYGIDAVPDLVESAEDIARFDYILIVANNEVDIDTINMIHTEKSNPYKQWDPQLVQWCWSRKTDQILMTEEALRSIMEYSIKLGGLYSQHIPLIQGENIRLKLSKIAVMIAARLFSSDKTGELIVIKKEHVDAAMIFISMIYKKKASAYFYASEVRKEQTTVKDLSVLKKYINTYKNADAIITYLITSNFISPYDMSDYINQPKDTVREILSVLLKHGCIQKKYSSYVKNQGFSEWLKKTRSL